MSTPSSESPALVSITPTTSDEILSCDEVETFRRFVAQLNPPLATSTSTLMRPYLLSLAHGLLILKHHIT